MKEKLFDLNVVLTDRPLPYLSPRSDYDGQQITRGGKLVYLEQLNEVFPNLRENLGFIDYNIKKPANPKSFELGAWSIINGLVIMSWIINSVIPEIVCIIMHADSAREAWQELEEHYRTSNAP